MKLAKTSRNNDRTDIFFLNCHGILWTEWWDENTVMKWNDYTYIWYWTHCIPGIHGG